MTLGTIADLGKFSLSVSIAVVLSACGSKDDPSRENFAATIDQYLQQKGRLCLESTTWPATVLMTKSTMSTSARQMLALEEVGLTKRLEEANTWSRKFDLTETAKPYLVDRKMRVVKMGTIDEVSIPTLCWAQKKLDAVEQWDKPMQLGEFQMTEVLYTYKLENVAEWARSAEVQDAFPVIRQHLKDGEQGKGRMPVKLTSEGWQVLDFK